MNLENVRKLIEALRSGKYRQTKGKLRDYDGFCCLGVACDISGMGKWIEPLMSFGPFEYRILDVDGVVISKATDVLPYVVAKWLGISVSGEFHLPGQEFDVRDYEDYSSSTFTSLADLNDNRLTFAEIADVLENAILFDWSDAPDALVQVDN